MKKNKSLLKIIYKADKNNYKSEELSNIFPHYSYEDFGNLDEINAHLKKLSELYNQKIPKDKKDCFLYLTSDFNVNYYNFYSRFLFENSFPRFFQYFPKGNIWILKVNNDWSDITNNYPSRSKKPPWSPSQHFSGLLSENFPSFALRLLCYGHYPMMIANYIQVEDLIFLYIAEKSFNCTQENDENRNFNNFIFKYYEIYDDQWTFDGGRGVKTKFFNNLIPITNLEYFEYYLEIVNNRMNDLIQIKDPFKREILGMTVNRCIADALLSINLAMPYLFKIFFFGCLDKIANVMWSIGNDINENKAWEKIVSKRFLNNSLRNCVKKIPGEISIYMQNIIDEAIFDIKKENILSPEDFKDFRNTIHGYNLRKDAFLRLMKKSGEMNNDITLLVLPLMLFILDKKWKVA